MKTSNDKLDLTKVSNSNIYTFQADESATARTKRLEAIAADIQTRFEIINDFLERKPPANVMEPDTRYGINLMLNKVETIKQLLYISGIVTPEDYEDMYNIVADNSITNLDTDKGRIKGISEASGLGKAKGPGLYIPGKN